MASGKNSKIMEFESILSEILDPQELEVFAVRPKGCEVIFSNTKENSRFSLDVNDIRSCKSSYAKNIPEICDNCPYGGKNDRIEPRPFEIKDTKDRVYSARCSTINWIDGKPASIFILRDITKEIETKERLHALAYIDQLTGIPNRQSLKDTFSAMRDEIVNNELSGVVALFDLDNFKMINDTYGHNTGDMVLRRLTEHLQEDDMFTGHLYRLGGDEFVLLYADEAGKYGTDEEMKQHYCSLLSTALRAYTLPNIEVKCTLSIGVSVFPAHGDSLSEVLRKADIALYKAKAEGRNRIVFFESQYDTAQKFKDLYINLQPILNADGNTFGYELVDRGTEVKEDDETVSLDEFNRTVDALGLDALGLNDIENDILYFTTYSKQLLNPAVLMNLPRDKFIVQVQLSNALTKSELEKELQICLELQNNGYKLALVDLHSNSPAQAVLSFVDYCKFSSDDKNIMKQKGIIAANNKVRFIATGIDTPEAFRSAKNTGFQLFQGFYFNQPVVGTVTKEISPLKTNYFRLLKLSSTDDYMNFREISSIISSDVALTYKLLRILNSAAVGLKNVASISVAVAYMGEENLKKWIAVLALRGIAEDKPLELVRMSLIRARFGELLANQFKTKRDLKQVFMVGMLSLLHIALDMTVGQLLDEIAVAEVVRDSLMTKNGLYSDLLKFFENYEHANWDAVTQYAEENQLDSEYVNDAYISAVKWYKNLVE